MAEPNLKLVPDKPSAEAAAERKAKPRWSRRSLRFVLLVVAPLIALAIGLGFYLSGGRYVSTDNAYVGAQKVLITPDISGKIAGVSVREGQHVKAGDELLRIDPQPFQLAVAQAQAKIASVRTDFAALKSNLQSYTQLAQLAHQNTELKQHDVERKQTLFESRTGSQAELDATRANAVSARLQEELAAQRKEETLNQLQRDPNLPIEKFPAYMQAQAALDQAQRDLDHAVLRAPIDGVATQVDNIQLGRFVTAGTPVFSIIDDTAPWIDANPKETDITYLRPGQRVTVEVDTFPDHVFTGSVAAVSPGTGAQFSILPPQNASGNWVKVVQRVPVRIQLDRDPALSRLRAGMSANVDIDTGHRRTLASLFGRAHAEEAPTEAR